MTLGANGGYFAAYNADDKICGTDKNQQEEPGGGKADGQIFEEIDSVFKAAGKGVRHAVAEGFRCSLRAGELVYLIQREIDRGKIDKSVVMAQRTGELFNLIFRFADGGFDGDDVGHVVGFFQKVLQAVELDVRRFKTGLGIVIGYGCKER